MLISWCQFICSCWWLTILSATVHTFKRMKLLKLIIIGFIKGYIVVKNNFSADVTFNPIQDEHFRGCSWTRGGEKTPILKICQTYPIIMKLGTVIPYLEKIQKLYESRVTSLEFCLHQQFFTRKQQVLLYQEIQI